MTPTQSAKFCQDKQSGKCKMQYGPASRLFAPWAYPKHPVFPKDTKVDDVFTNVAIIRERSTWAATTDTNHVPPFGQGAIVQVAWDKPTQINAALMPGNLKESRMDVDGREKDHMPILIRAWAYILSKRRTVLIHEAQLSQSWSCNVNQDSGTHFSTGNSTIEVDIGEVEADAAQRWSVLFYQMMVAGTRLFKARMARSCIFCGLSD
ncbi:uncharacterized protein FPRO_07641 [Fusarium proliferatum ET1]|uniref:Uncharacterized protein n=1 Tax=Fusarium proliferatum (strain ET1) TaxID=1227346 RepID=A0A1L7VSP3_FUSPR|nr:uncharacterized protein FPRO_07641 [Fusarium proliferatum ET1]CZR43442.1 uncharacterized protein FPRO_07641 [Fusarium proliferatum ET1]